MFAPPQTHPIGPFFCNRHHSLPLKKTELYLTWQFRSDSLFPPSSYQSHAPSELSLACKNTTYMCYNMHEWYKNSCPSERHVCGSYDLKLIQIAIPASNIWPFPIRLIKSSCKWGRRQKSVITGIKFATSALLSDCYKWASFRWPIESAVHSDISNMKYHVDVSPTDWSQFPSFSLLVDLHLVLADLRLVFQVITSNKDCHVVSVVAISSWAFQDLFLLVKLSFRKSG